MTNSTTCNLPFLPAADFHADTEDEEAKRPDPVVHPLHVFLLAGRRRGVRRAGVRVGELPQAHLGAEAQRDEEEVSLLRGRLPRNRASGAASRTSSRRETVEICWLFLLCYNSHHHHW